MNLCRCPYCHARISLDALVQDEAGRELMIIFAKMRPAMAGAMLAYLSLFRPEKQDLRNDRALSLAKEVIKLASADLLKQALTNAVAAARERQTKGVWRKPKDHGWLKAFIVELTAKSGPDTRGAAYVDAKTKPFAALESDADSRQKFSDLLEKMKGRKPHE